MSISPDLIGGYSLYYRDFFAISLLYSVFLVPLQPVKKSYRLLYTILLLLLFGCIGHRYPQALLDADSLMADHSDSAVAILNQIAPEMSTASESVRRYYQLLRIEADDKTDKIDISPDSIKDLVHYYEEDGDEAMLPKAYYYAGRVYSDLNEAPISLSYFQKSLKAMEDNGTNDLHLQSVIYSQMGYLYLFQYIYDEAERCFRASYEIGVKTNDTISIFWGLNDLGSTCQWQNKYEECLKYYKKAKEIAAETNNMNMKANIDLSIASVLKSIKDYPKAMRYMQVPMRNINLLDSTNVFSVMTELYDKLGEKDSFLLYLEKLDNVANIYAKEYVYKRKLELNLDKLNNNEAKNYYSMFLLYHDSINSTTRSAELQKVNSIYDLNKAEAKSAELEKQKLIRDLLLLLLLFTLLALTTYLYSLRKRNLERFKRFRILHREIQLMNKNTQSLDSDYHKRALMNIKSSAVYLNISEKVKFDTALKKSDWVQVEALVNENYPNFKERLLDLYNFSSHEYHLCMLIKIGMTPSQIGILTAHSNSSITQTRKRLYKKCFGQDGNGEKWDAFIRSL